MGTEIQVKSNLLGHYSMKDHHNDNSNICSWPPYPEDDVLPNSHYYDGYLPRSAAEACPVLGKDILKQTMLEHEAIFRKQVLELHRLYTKQKELMNEFKRQDMYKGRVAVETSLASSPLASQITSEDVTKWHSPGAHLVNSSHNLRPFTSVVEGIQSPASFVRVNSTQAVDVAIPIGFGVKSSVILDSTRPSKVGRKMFDLQLPANQYIDDDEPELVKDDKFPEVLATPPKEDAMAELWNDVIPTGLNSVRTVADLNKPLEVDETTGSEHVHLHGNSFAQSSNLGNNNEVASSHSVIITNNGIGWLSILEAGEGKSKRFVSLGDQMQNSLASVICTEQSQLGQSRERRIHGLDITEFDNCPESVTSSHLSPHYIFSSPLDPAKSWSKSVTNLERHGSCSFNQNTPSQNGLSLETTSCSYSKVKQPSGYQGGSGDKRKFPTEFAYQNGFHPGSSSFSREPPSQLHSVAYNHYSYCAEDAGVKEFVWNRNDENHHRHSSSEVRNAARLVDLNATLWSGPSGGQFKVKKIEDRPKIPTWLMAETGFNNEAALRQVDLNESVLGGGPSSCMINKGRSMEDHPKIPPWLKPETGFSNKDHSSVDHDIGRKNETGRGLEGNKTLYRRMLSVPYCNDDQNNSGQSPRDKKILGFCISEQGASRPLEGTVSDYDRKTRLLDINLPCDSVPELAKPSSAGCFIADKGNDLKVSHCIDLNLVVSGDEDSAMPYVPSKRGKRIPDIDLEAPASPDEEFGLVYGLEVVVENGEKSSRSVDEGMVSAAEAIVAISSTVHYGFSIDKIYFLAGCMEDPLNWFADVAMSCLNGVMTTSAAVISKCKPTQQQDGETTSEDIDDFESMTLKLTEVKSEDYFPKPFVSDIPIEAESVANPTLSRPRRGQARRGRQRRDFQRDILPGLTSLSRHEVTEDLQMFVGLMRATGHVWQSGLTRRNSRSGSARGRRRTSVASQITLLPPVLQQQSSVEDRSLTSRGKTTRRPRRQRCAVGNSTSIPL